MSHFGHSKRRQHADQHADSDSAISTARHGTAVTAVVEANEETLVKLMSKS